MPQFWKKFKISSWLAICVLLALLVSPAMAGIIQITTGSYVNTDPSIDNDNIAWIRNIDGKGQVFLYNLNNRAEVQITSNSADHYHPLISGYTIVYTSDNTIYYYDIPTHTETPVTTSYDILPQHVYISGQRILWGEGQRIYVYDVTSRTKVEIKYPQIIPSPEEGCMPFSGFSGDSIPIICGNNQQRKFEIYLSNIFTGDASLLVSDAQIGPFATLFTLSFSGHRIAWDDFRNGEYSLNPKAMERVVTSKNSDIYMYDLDTKTETQITNDPANQTVFAISKDTLWYFDDRAGVAELVTHDIPTSRESRISLKDLDYYMLSSQSGVSGDKFVFKRETPTREPEGNIFLYSPTIAGASPSVVPDQQKLGPTKTEIPAILNLSGFAVAVFIFTIFKRRS